MKKSTIKLTSALLMLSLMSTSLSAATASFDEKTTIKIQRLYRDRKLNQVYEFLNQTGKDIKRGVVPAPTKADLEKSIASLNEHSDFKSMGLPAVFFKNAKDLDIRPFVGLYQGYIQSQMASHDPIGDRWLLLLWRNSQLKLLQKVINSIQRSIFCKKL